MTKLTNLLKVTALLTLLLILIPIPLLYLIFKGLEYLIPIPLVYLNLILKRLEHLYGNIFNRYVDALDEIGLWDTLNKR